MSASIKLPRVVSKYIDMLPLDARKAVIDGLLATAPKLGAEELADIESPDLITIERMLGNNEMGDHIAISRIIMIINWRMVEPMLKLPTGFYCELYKAVIARRLTKSTNELV